MSTRLCAVCRAPLGSQHIGPCTIGKLGSLVVDVQCIDAERESALLWVMLRLHILEQQGLIKRDSETTLRLSTKGVLGAIDYYAKNPQPSRDVIVATCAWLFRTKIPVTAITAEALTTLVLDAEGTTSAKPN